VDIVTADSEAGVVGQDLDAVKRDDLPEVHYAVGKRLLDGRGVEREIPRLDSGSNIVHSFHLICEGIILHFISCETVDAGFSERNHGEQNGRTCD
jgi:hypothetical protein